MSGSIDFEGIKKAALCNGRALLQKLIPGGKFRSLEYIALNPRRNDKTLGSFKINYRSGVWNDFATGDGGSDLISLVAYVRDIDQGAAARELADLLGVPFLQTDGDARPKARPNDINGCRHNGAAAANETPKVYRWDDDGPPKRDEELRRHVYWSAGRPVRMKIRMRDGGFVNWYRAFRNGVPIGWQAKKPADYIAIPYLSTALDPFDAELKADEVLWPEGEKDVDTLSRLNLPAFTFGGVGDGLPDGIGQYLKDRRVVILVDNDDPGRKHAQDKVQVAYDAGAASVRTVHFAELPPKEDVSYFIENGGTKDELQARMDAAPLSSPATVTREGQTRPSPPAGRQHWRERVVTAGELQTMTFPPVRHILPGYISEGATIIAGKPKIGKSWLILDLFLAATADRFTLGTLKPSQGDGLYLALEDSNRRLKHRMSKLWPAAEARWPHRLSLVTEWKRADEGGLDDIEEWCQNAANPMMVGIDTLEKFRPVQKGKAAAYSADYEAVSGLQKLASKYSIAIVISHHVRKMEADDPFDTVSGTLGLTGAADTIIILRRHAGAVTLHARGRDIEEVETALQFDRATCRWTILGAASEVLISNQRAAVLNALSGAGPDGLAVGEIMVATGSNRGAMDTMLFKMKQAGEIVRLKRATYALPQDRGKIGQKERCEEQASEKKGLNGNLSDLHDLTGPANLPPSDAIDLSIPDFLRRNAKGMS